MLDAEVDFAARLRGVLLAWLGVAAPYHTFAGKFFKIAAEPTSPLSPFSPQSAPAREASIGIFREVLDGSRIKVDAELRQQLPELLWLLHMGVVLFWVHDQSPGAAATSTLIKRTVPLVDRLIGLSRLRVLRPITRDVVRLIDEVRRDAAPTGPADDEVAPVASTGRRQREGGS